MVSRAVVATRTLVHLGTSSHAQPRLTGRLVVWFRGRVPAKKSYITINKSIIDWIRHKVPITLTEYILGSKFQGRLRSLRTTLKAYYISQGGEEEEVLKH